jgi:predicted TIM-barrel fold metal-dependent hydrolase
LGYGISDADQHFYEAPDSITKYLDPEYRHAFRWIELDGRKTLLLNDRLYKLIPNPTYDPVGVPGSMVEFFKGHNPEGKTLRELAGDPQALDPAFRYREPRMKVLDEQGIELCIMLPTQALGLEQCLWEDPPAVVAVMRALNRWIHEEWSWNIDNRIFVTGIVSLIDPDEAENELDILLSQGCKAIGLRSGPVQVPGRYYSMADKRYDRFWAKCAEANVPIGLHGADTAYSPLMAMWGEDSRFGGHRKSTMGEVVDFPIGRAIYDTMAAFVCHGAFDRHPKLKTIIIEQGAQWIPYFVDRLKISYGKTPQLYNTDPVQQFIDHTWVMPFYEDDLHKVTASFPVERLVYGSDWPHPEGYAEPDEYIGDLATFTPAEQKMIMRDNLRACLLG